jgi:parallel beta-helix repeat protein
MIAIGTVVAIVGVLLPLSPAHAATTFGPDADAYVDGSHINRNFGTRPFMRVDASPHRVAYVRFTVSGAGQPGSGLLRIWAASSNDGVEIYDVDDDSWGEDTITYANRPALGVEIGATTASVSAGSWIEVDVSSVVQGDGVYTLAVVSSDTTALKLDSREGTNAPELVVPAPAAPTSYTIIGSGSSYTATSDTSPPTVFTGDLKPVVEAAAADLERFGGGTVVFAAGQFDLGAEHFEFDDVDAISFVGQGIDVTTISNNASAADDTEIFDFVHADHVLIQDMTLSAGGPDRSTSDAIDFDDGRNSTVLRVRVADSRGRGIVFDGKGVGWVATGNRVANCVIENVPGDGIELLASSNNVIEECTITSSGGHGIQVTKASAVAAVPNKPSNSNTLRNNAVGLSGRDGININSGSDNIVVGNNVTDGSQATTGRDGVRIESFDGVSCDRNNLESNSLTDDQPVATQRYGINIADPECADNVIGSSNVFSGNAFGDINDGGTNTTLPTDTTAPSVPTGVAAVALSAFEVSVTWDPSSDNLGVTGYAVYRDGVEVGSVPGGQTSFADTSVLPDTTYQYTVDAVDAAANRSAQSAPPASVTTPSPPSAFTVVAEADAYVDAASGSTNFGSSTQLRADGLPLVRSFVRFTVNSNGAALDSVLLRVHPGSSHSLGFEVVSVADNSWDEATVTHDSAPLTGAVVGASGPVSAGTYVEIDVSSVVTQDGTYSFALVPLNNTNLRMSSRATANAPELAVTLQ